MKKANSRQLSLKQKEELAALAVMPDEQIDTLDLPEATDWRDAKRGVFYRPIKQQITLRLDADLIAWFKAQSKTSNGDGYQTRINQALREYITQYSNERLAGG